jgi:hypothetical protein
VDAQLGEKALRLAALLQLSPDLIAKFVGLGISELAAFSDVTAEDLVGTSITEDEFNTVLAAVAKAKTAGQA